MTNHVTTHLTAMAYMWTSQPLQSEVLTTVPNLQGTRFFAMSWGQGLQISRADPHMEVPATLTLFLGQTSPLVNICEQIFKKDLVVCGFGVQGQQG